MDLIPRSIHWPDSLSVPQVFSVLLGVSLADAAALFAAPATVLALSLVEHSDGHLGNGALAYAVATDKLMSILQTQYLTHEALWADLLSMPFDRALAPDSDVPDGLLYEQLPRGVADAYVAARRSLPLVADALAALVAWQTGMGMDCPLSAEAMHSTTR